MGLTLAELDQWDPGDIREVFHCATSIAQADADAANGIATMPIFQNWGGSTGDAARGANNGIRHDLDSLGREMASVATAARTAATDLDSVKRDLKKLRTRMSQRGVGIDATTGKVTMGRDFTGSPLDLILFQGEIDAILARADQVDTELAHAVDMAMGKEPIPDADGTNIEDAIHRPLPQDPAEFYKLWSQLTDEQKDYLFSQDPNIGNHPGMPAGDDTYRGSNYYNRKHLAADLADARAAQAELDRLLAEHPDWKPPWEQAVPSTGRSPIPPEYLAWRERCRSAHDRAAHLGELNSIDKALHDNSDTYLLNYDPTSGERMQAAIAVGNPDTADHISVSTPGLNTTVSSIEGMTHEASALRREALRQLTMSPGHEHETVSTVAWICYDAPQVHPQEDPTGAPGGAWDVTHDDVAKRGAEKLASFYDGLGASHQGERPQLTAIGHSYGSLVTGLALQQPGNHGVTDAIFYGSPGIEATTPEQLGVRPGHAFVMEAPDDPIQWAYDGPPLAKASLLPLMPIPVIGPVATGLEGLLLGADATGAGDFGPNPATNPNFVRLTTGDIDVSDGNGNTIHYPAAHGHSDYPRTVGNDQLHSTGYNIANVIAGLSDRAVRGK